MWATKEEGDSAESITLRGPSQSSSKLDDSNLASTTITTTVVKGEELKESPSPVTNTLSNSLSEGQKKGFRGKHDPFGNEEGAEVKYKTAEWWQIGMLMIAETISLGILSLPAALGVLGLVPGIILIIALGLLATYTGYVIGQFRERYPHIHNLADAGEVLAGSWGREILGVAQILFFVFIMGSHILTFALMMNTLTEHGACTVIWAFVGLVISIICTLPRTMKKTSYLATASFISIGGAVGITIISVAITKPGLGHVDYTTTPSFHQGFLAVSNIVFAYAGHAAFFSFISELKNPKDYTKALCLLQISDTTMYIVAAVVIYWYAGKNVGSPALDSTTPIVRKVAYGVAIPTIVVSGVINGHVACKYIYLRMLRGGTLMHKRNWRSYGLWVGLATFLWIIAFIIAEAIPVFNDLLGITSALFASWFTFGLAGFFWFHMNKEDKKWRSNWKKIALSLLNILNIFIGLILCIAGLYASGVSMRQHAQEGTGGAFSCKDNSGGRLD